MKKLITFTMLMIILLAGCAASRSSIPVLDYSVPHNQSDKRPIFSFQTVNMADTVLSSEGVFIIYINIPYPQLRFI